MSQTTTQVLLPQTTWLGNVQPVPVYNVVGEKKPGASYYLAGKDLQTVNINLAGVTGNILIQATLATEPAELDWFTVHTLEANASAPPNSIGNLNAYTNQAVNINGNFVWMRAEVKDFAGGVVQFVKVSY